MVLESMLAMYQIIRSTLQKPCSSEVPGPSCNDGNVHSTSVDRKSYNFLVTYQARIDIAYQLGQCSHGLLADTNQMCSSGQ